MRFFSFFFQKISPILTVDVQDAGIYHFIVKKKIEIRKKSFYNTIKERIFLYFFATIVSLLEDYFNFLLALKLEFLIGSFSWTSKM